MNLIIAFTAVCGLGDDYRASLPAVADQYWSDVLQSPDLWIYTRAEMPRAYQHAGGFHDPRYNISGDAQQQGKFEGGNWNNESPWRNPGGVDAAEAISRAAKFLKLPRERDRLLPVVWWPEIAEGHFGGDREQVIRWVFPAGTIFGEVLTMRGPDDRLHTWEVRLRTRVETGWDVEILRPFPTRKDFADRLAKDGFSLTPPRIEPVVFRDRHARPVFQFSSTVDVLPPISSEYAMRLLDSTPFRPVGGEMWTHDSVAPTSDSLSIVPPRYEGAKLGLDSDSCNLCHRTTLQHGTAFEVRHVGKYGRIVGSDGVFSWHPIARETISGNGSIIQPRFNPEFERRGWIERFNRSHRESGKYFVQKGVL